MSGPILSARDVAVNKTKSLPVSNLYFNESEQTDNKQINKKTVCQIVTNSMEKYKAEEERRMTVYLSHPVYTDSSCLNFFSVFEYSSFFLPLGAETPFCLRFPIVFL